MCREKSVSKFALSGSNFDDVDYILDISPGSDVLDESDGTDSLLGSFGFLCTAETLEIADKYDSDD